MRTLLAVSFIVALAACGSKAKPATTPDPERSMSTESAAPDGSAGDEAEEAPKGAAPDDETQADPCGGGE